MNVGKIFEDDFKKSIPKDIYFFKIPDPACAFNKSAERFSKKNPFDLFCFNGKNLFTLELKTVKGNSISYYKEGYKNPSSGIQKHQIEELTKAASCSNVISGVVIDYRKSESVYFIPILALNEHIKNNKKSRTLHIKDAKKNGFKIEKKLKKVRYTYLVDDFFTKEGSDFYKKYVREG